jgi:hypothetical protein
MVVDRIDRQADHLAVALLERGPELGQIAELGGADRSEVLGVREQDSPAVAEPVVEAKPPAGGLGLEIGGAIADAQCHVCRLLGC